MKLKEIMTQFPNLSLKKIAEGTNTSYQYLLKASKKPIPEVAYDPDNFNHDAVEEIIRRKIPLEDVDFEELNSTVKAYEPVSKPDEFQPDTKFTIRGEKDTFKVILLTPTHIVFVGEASTQPRVMNYDTFLHQSPKIVAATEALKEIEILSLAMEAPEEPLPVISKPKKPKKTST